MRFNRIITNRRSIRLKEYDYSQDGYYYVTICTRNRECWFGDIVNGEMKLSDIGKIVEQYWIEITKHFDNTLLNVFVMMPNHLHGIVVIENSFKDRNRVNRCQQLSVHLNPP